MSGKSFAANLYFEGRPVVLNQQRLASRLQDQRITRKERLDVEVALAGEDVSKLISVADCEDDEPLLLRFVSDKDRYLIKVGQVGDYYGWGFSAPGKDDDLSVSDVSGGFFIAQSESSARVAPSLGVGPMSVILKSEQAGLYLSARKLNGTRVFRCVYAPGASASEGTFARFVLKVVG